eukprot:jgi/Bigna1/81773/fgenesh1_pg.84_\
MAPATRPPPHALLLLVLMMPMRSLASWSYQLMNTSFLNDENYQTCAYVGTTIWCPPYGKSGATTPLIKIDTTNDAVETIIEPLISNVEKAYASCQAVGSNIFCAPFGAEYVLMINTTAGNCSLLNHLHIPVSITAGGSYRSCHAVGTNVWCIPYTAPYVLKIDSMNVTNTQLKPTNLTERYVSGRELHNDIMSTSIWCAPYSTVFPMKVDTQTENITVFYNHDYDAMSAQRWVACSAVGTDVYCFNYWASAILQINTINANITLLSPSSSTKFTRCCRTIGTNIMCARYNSNAKSIIFDTLTRSYTEYHVAGSSPSNWMTQVFALHTMLNYILKMNATAAVNGPTKYDSADQYFTCISVDGKKAYCAPYDADYILVIEGFQGTSAPTVSPITDSPTTDSPSASPITDSPATYSPSASPITDSPATYSPSASPITDSPTTDSPSASPITDSPTTDSPSASPITDSPTTYSPSTYAPTTASPITDSPATVAPTTSPTVEKEWTASIRIRVLRPYSDLRIGTFEQDLRFEFRTAIARSAKCAYSQTWIKSIIPGSIVVNGGVWFGSETRADTWTAL